MRPEDKERMESAGYDVNGALARFVNNEILFMTFLKKFPTDEHYAAIRPNIDNGNIDEAYKAAHAIKGVAGNLGLTPVFETVNDMLILIKHKDETPDFDTKVVELYEIFDKAYAKAIEIINSIE